MFATRVPKPGYLSLLPSPAASNLLPRISGSQLICQGTLYVVIIPEGVDFEILLGRVDAEFLSGCSGR